VRRRIAFEHERFDRHPIDGMRQSPIDELRDRQARARVGFQAGINFSEEPMITEGVYADLHGVPSGRLTTTRQRARTQGRESSRPWRYCLGAHGRPPFRWGFDTTVLVR
jgi:hypothetical protein